MPISILVSDAFQHLCVCYEISYGIDFNLEEACDCMDGLLKGIIMKMPGKHI